MAQQVKETATKPQDPHGRRRKLTSKSCPLAHTNKQTRIFKYNKKIFKDNMILTKIYKFQGFYLVGWFWGFLRQVSLCSSPVGPEVHYIDYFSLKIDRDPPESAS